MNKRDICGVLTDNGWDCTKDGAGDISCLLNISNIQILVIPGIKKIKGKIHLWLDESLSTTEFTEAINFIFNKKSRYRPLIAPWNSNIELEANKVISNDVELLMNKVIDWAKIQNVEDCINIYSENCPDRPGSKQLNHLAALAMKGNVHCIKGYQSSFIKGDHLNFVPMITLDVLDRSVELATMKSKQ